MNTKETSIADRLKNARVAAGFTSARTFALKHSIPYITYSQHEAGKRELRPDVIVRYSELLKISPSWLLLGHEDEKPAREKQHLETNYNNFFSVSETNSKNSSINMDVFFEILSEVSKLSKKLALAPSEKDKMKLCIEIYNSIIIYDFDLILKNNVLKSLVNTIIKAESKTHVDIKHHNYQRGGYEKKKRS